MSFEDSLIRLSPKRISKGLLRVGFDVKLVPVMTAIALAESFGLPRAHNRDQLTGDNSYGLFQINMIGDIGVERRQLLGLSNNDDLFRPGKNLEAAKLIFDQQGLKAWGAYRNGSYRNYLDLLMADESYLKVIRGISFTPVFILAASNVRAELSHEGSLVFRFAANESSSKFISDGFHSDGLITRKLLQRWEQRVWDDDHRSSDTRRIMDDFTLSLLPAHFNELVVPVKESVHFDSFVKKNDNFFLEIDQSVDSFKAFHGRLDEVTTIQGNILFVMDYGANCGNEFTVGAAHLP